MYYGTFYANLAQQQYRLSIKLTPPRAPIFDRNGKYLACNKEAFSAFLLPNRLKEEKKTIGFLKKYFPQAHSRLKKNENSSFMFIKRNISPLEIETIEQKDISDIKILKEPARWYSHCATSPIIGITDIDNHGIMGLEMVFNDHLSGSPTLCTLSKDARSKQFHFHKKINQMGSQPKPLYLTLDSTLQFMAYESVTKAVNTYKAQEGAALILNPENGELLAMVNYPCFDPNNELSSLKHTKNTLVTESYELGSVMKIFVALAALEENVVELEELFDCKNTKSAHVHGLKINTVIPHGKIPFEQIIKGSNNIGMVQIAHRLQKKLYTHYKKLGFESRTGINFPGEQKGFINPPHKWSKRSFASLSFGYEISATLLQLARAFSTLVNGGFLITPHLLLGQEKKPTLENQKPLYSQETIQTIRTILHEAVKDGTAHRAQIPGFFVMGKTGTANLLKNGTYCPENNIYTFVGSIEKENYKRVVVTFIKNSEIKNLYASQVAVPLFKDIAEHMIFHDKII